MNIDNLNNVKCNIINQGHPVPSVGLTGMISDLYYFLEQSGLLKVTKVTKTGDPYLMLDVRCDLTANAESRANFIDVVETIWLNDLRYTEFEAHVISHIDDGIVLDFITGTSQEGSTSYITGSIIISKLTGGKIVT